MIDLAEQSSDRALQVHLGGQLIQQSERPKPPASELIGIVLAGLIYAQLPSSAAWVLGLLLGINLVMAGASFLALTWGEGATVDARMTPTPS